MEQMTVRHAYNGEDHDAPAWKVEVVLSDGTQFHMVERYPGKLEIIDQSGNQGRFCVLPVASNTVELCRSEDI